MSQKNNVNESKNVNSNESKNKQTRGIFRLNQPAKAKAKPERKMKFNTRRKGTSK